MGLFLRYYCFSILAYSIIQHAPIKSRVHDDTPRREDGCTTNINNTSEQNPVDTSVSNEMDTTAAVLHHSDDTASNSTTERTNNRRSLINATRGRNNNSSDGGDSDDDCNEEEKNNKK